MNDKHKKDGKKFFCHRQNDLVQVDVKKNFSCLKKPQTWTNIFCAKGNYFLSTGELTSSVVTQFRITNVTSRPEKKPSNTTIKATM